ncbi:hypothetical protein ACLBKS_07170 [Hylemonella sp. W303a]|uniref:hypothetical protein n=1 Tax=Hylemonella sp. W303a TaxID=3389873 RepID=UPI00396B1172
MTMLQVPCRHVGVLSVKIFPDHLQQPKVLCQSCSNPVNLIVWGDGERLGTSDKGLGVFSEGASLFNKSDGALI